VTYKVELGVTPDPIPNSVVKPGNADDPQGVHRLEACATMGKVGRRRCTG